MNTRYTNANLSSVNSVSYDYDYFLKKKKWVNIKIQKQKSATQGQGVRQVMSTILNFMLSVFFATVLNGLYQGPV